MSRIRPERCDRCTYWEVLVDEDGTVLGLCRCNPPSYEGWPMSRPEDWCGRFQALPDV